MVWLLFHPFLFLKLLFYFIFLCLYCFKFWNKFLLSLDLQIVLCWFCECLPLIPLWFTESLQSKKFPPHSSPFFLSNLGHSRYYIICFFLLFSLRVSYRSPNETPVVPCSTYFLFFHVFFLVPNRSQHFCSTCFSCCHLFQTSAGSVNSSLLHPTKGTVYHGELSKKITVRRVVCCCGQWCK